MMGPRSPIIKSGPQAISCGQREVLAAMARLAKVIVPNRVPTLPSRYRNGGYGSGLLVVPDEPDGDPQLSHWHRCIPVGQSIDDRSRLDRAMPRARSRSVNLLYGAKRRYPERTLYGRILCSGLEMLHGLRYHPRTHRLGPSGYFSGLIIHLYK